MLDITTALTRELAADGEFSDDLSERLATAVVAAWEAYDRQEPGRFPSRYYVVHRAVESVIPNVYFDIPQGIFRVLDGIYRQRDFMARRGKP